MSLKQLLQNYAIMLQQKIKDLEHTYPAKTGDLKNYMEELKRVEQTKQEASDATQS